MSSYTESEMYFGLGEPCEVYVTADGKKYISIDSLDGIIGSDILEEILGDLVTADDVLVDEADIMVDGNPTRFMMNLLPVEHRNEAVKVIQKFIAGISTHMIKSIMDAQV